MEGVSGFWRWSAGLAIEIAHQDNLLDSRQITKVCSAVILMMVGFLKAAAFISQWKNVLHVTSAAFHCAGQKINPGKRFDDKS